MFNRSERVSAAPCLLLTRDDERTQVRGNFTNAHMSKKSLRGCAPLRQCQSCMQNFLQPASPFRRTTSTTRMRRGQRSGFVATSCDHEVPQVLVVREHVQSL